MNTAPVISVEKLSLRLKGPSGEVSILKELSLRVNAGETLGIIGPSGSGKTSLLLVLAGLERASGGTVQVGGYALETMGEDALATFRRDTLGIVFQNFHLIASMSALENVALPMEFAGRPHAFAQARQALESVGLAHRARHFPAQLSGGEQQRVALARAFVMCPKILLADEPTGNLDQENGAQVMRQMFALQEEHGTTLLLITHDKALAARCSRTLTLRDGRIEAP